MKRTAGRQGDRWRHVAAPLRDVLGGLDRVLAPPRRAGAALALVFAGLAVGWWLYVPIHELLHVAGCLLAGGRVERLDLDPLYGADLLARVFPFVHSGSEYAGRLSGFDTRGSDAIYLATDLAPFVLALLPGLWAVRRAARAGRPFLFGTALPAAISPWLSATGDAYEIGSLAVVNLPGFGESRAELVGDDLFLRAGELAKLHDAPWAGFVLAVLLGLAWAAATTALGSWLAERLGEPVTMAAVPARRAR
jgi:hypothetical protein